jgi:hypothetical protein
MDDAFGNSLAVEVREFVDQVMVLEQDGTAGRSGARVLIVGDRGSAIGGQSLLECHRFLPLT